MSSDGRIVEEVRERVMKISEEFDHDLRRYAGHLKDIEKQYAARVVDQVTVVKSTRSRDEGA